MLFRAMNVLSAVFILCALPIGAQIHWTHVGDTPVMPHGEEGSWNSGSLFMPRVIKEGDTLKMWYTGINGGLLSGQRGVGYAWSLDDIQWQQHPDNPLATLGGNAGPVIKDGELYKMWFTAGPVFKYATSKDGITWNVHPDPVLALGEAGDWDADIPVFAAECVIKQADTYMLWYSGSQGTFPNATIQFGLATSEDGIHWTKYNDPNTTEPPFVNSDPVIMVGNANSWDAKHLKGICVVSGELGYQMWYSGLGVLGPRQWIGYGLSQDGIHWTKCPTNPIVDSCPMWGQWGYYPGTILKQDDHYHMWYCSFDAVGDHPQIGYATSPVINHDVSVVSSPPYLTSLPLHAKGITPAAVIQNHGRFDEADIPVSCEIESDGVQIFSDTQTLDALAGANFAWEQVPVEFKTWKTGDMAEYTVLYFTQLEGDDCFTNDTLRTTIVVDTLMDDFEYAQDELPDVWQIDSSWTLTTKAHSGKQSLISSDSSLYKNNTNASATYKYVFDLSTLNDAYLSFWTLYSLKDNDHGYVEVSTDGGTSWTALGEPYTGTQLTSWTCERFCLNHVCGARFSDVRFRFRLETDSSDVSIGWFIDDVALVPEALPTRLTSEQSKLPTQITLYQNYPNPFNPTTQVTFTVPNTTLVRIHVYNVRGELIRTLLNQQMASGTHTVTWGGQTSIGQDAPSGVYLYRLAAEDVSITRKMLLVR